MLTKELIAQMAIAQWHLSYKSQESFDKSFTMLQGVLKGGAIVGMKVTNHLLEILCLIFTRKDTILFIPTKK